MKVFYLVRDDDGIRFIPSLVLRCVLPCEVLGEMSIDENVPLTNLCLKSINNDIRKDLEDV